MRFPHLVEFRQYRFPTSGEATVLQRACNVPALVVAKGTPSQDEVVASVPDGGPPVLRRLDTRIFFDVYISPTRYAEIFNTIFVGPGLTDARELTDIVNTRFGPNPFNGLNLQALPYPRKRGSFIQSVVPYAQIVHFVKVVNQEFDTAFRERLLTQREQDEEAQKTIAALERDAQRAADDGYTKENPPPPGYFDPRI